MSHPGMSTTAPQGSAANRELKLSTSNELKGWSLKKDTFVVSRKQQKTESYPKEGAAGSRRMANPRAFAFSSPNVGDSSPCWELDTIWLALWTALRLRQAPLPMHTFLSVGFVNFFLPVCLL